MNISVQLHHRLPPFVLPLTFYLCSSTLLSFGSSTVVLLPLLFYLCPSTLCPLTRVSLFKVIRVPNVGVSMDVDARDDISLPALPKGNGSHHVSDE